jgi:hypothetical protein
LQLVKEQEKIFNKEVQLQLGGMLQNLVKLQMQLLLVQVQVFKVKVHAQLRLVI